MEEKLKMQIVKKKIKISQHAGYYQLGGLQGLSIFLEKKPLWVHRVCMRLFLGFLWYNSK